MYADESAAVLLFNMIMMMIIKIIIQENTFPISENVQVYAHPRKNLDLVC